MGYQSDERDCANSMSLDRDNNRKTYMANNYFWMGYDILHIKWTTPVVNLINLYNWLCSPKCEYGEDMKI